MPDQYPTKHPLDIAALHYSNSIVDIDRPFGMQMMELGELRELTRMGHQARLFAKEVRGAHPLVHALPYHPCDRHLHDLPYYTRFVDRTPDVHIRQGNSTPLLVAFDPGKTVIRFDGYSDFPLAENEAVRVAYSRAHYIFVSHFLRGHYLKRYTFLSPDKCHVLYNAVESRPPVTKSHAAKLRMVFCSRWVADKGIFVLEAALKHLSTRRNDFDVFIAGGIHSTGGSVRIQEYESRIRNRLAALPNVTVLGYLRHAELTALFDDVDLLLFPSLWDEPFGLVPAEAALSAVPTIAFRVGALPEVVKNGQTGVLIAKSPFNRLNALRFARTLDRLLDRRDSLIEMGARARERVCRNFDWHRYGRTLLAIYDQVSRNDTETS